MNPVLMPFWRITKWMLSLLAPQLLIRLRDRHYARFAIERRKEEHRRCQNGERVCHLNELFVRHDGYVLPCCLVRGQEYMRIGHLSDPDLITKIMKFKEYCHCERYKLREARASEQIEHSLINIELSLVCQGRCVMCCVSAPGWRSPYPYYEEMKQLLTKLHPAELRVQGGEVLVQSVSLGWLREVRKQMPSMKMSLVSNGNVPMRMATAVEELFEHIIVSIVGFQPETYSSLMGLDLYITQSFVRALIEGTRTKVSLKYLVTPLGIHEAHLFIEWAITLHPADIFLEDSGTKGYVNEATSDSYWLKIIAHSADKVQRTIAANKERLSELRLKVGFDTRCCELYGVTNDFIQAHDLHGVVYRKKC